MATVKKSPSTPVRVKSQKAADKADANVDTPDDEEDEVEDLDHAKPNVDEPTADDEGEADADSDQDGETAEDAAQDSQDAQIAASEDPKPAKQAPKQAGFAQRVGRTSTAPVPPPNTARPYLDSPRDFGIHVKGLLCRFKKGRTSIKMYAANLAGVSYEDLLKALREDSYVRDNGAELVEE